MACVFAKKFLDVVCRCGGLSFDSWWCLVVVGLECSLLANIGDDRPTKQLVSWVTKLVVFKRVVYSVCALE